jgi:hypothetical protein
MLKFLVGLSFSIDIKDAFRFASPQVRDIAVKSVGQLNHLAIRNALASGAVHHWRPPRN